MMKLRALLILVATLLLGLVSFVSAMPHPKPEPGYHGYYEYSGYYGKRYYGKGGGQHKSKAWRKQHESKYGYY